MAEKKNTKIAVVGAGPMGLAVAYELSKMGYKPSIYESADRVGGMAICFDFCGESIERFYHFHCTSDIDFMTLLDELGIKEKLHWRKTRMGFYLNGKLQSWGNPIALLTFSGLSLISKIRYGVHALYSTKIKNWNHLDNQIATEWIQKWVGEEAYKKLWLPLFKYKFYEHSNELSASWIWARIRRIGTSRYNLMHEKLGYLQGGSQQYLDAMTMALDEKGAKLNVRTQVNKIVIENREVTGIETQSGFEKFDIVCSTIPMPYVPHIIPQLDERTKDRYLALKNVGVVCVIVATKKKITKNFWVNVNDEEMDIPGIVEYSNLRTMNSHITYVPFYMPITNTKFTEADDIFVKKVKTYLKKINTDLSEDDFIDLKVSRYKYSQPICGPNFLEKLPTHKTDISGLWVADTSHYYPEDRGISESTKFGKKLAVEINEYAKNIS